MFSVRPTFSQLTGNDSTKSFENAFQIIFSEIWMNRRYIDTIELLCFFCDSVDDGLGLWHIAGPANLNDEIIAQQPINNTKSSKKKKP